MLLGSVRRDRNLVRVTARLVDKIGTQLWTESYDRELKNIFAIQSEIARSVAGRIVNKIVPQDAPSAARTTTSVMAYDAYLIARALFNARSTGWTHEAEEDLTKAIELDPNFAPAHAMLAISYYYRFDLDVEETTERVCRSAQRAIDLAPNLAEANLAISFCHARNDNLQRQLESARRAVALDPSFSMAYDTLSNALLRLDRNDEARATRQQGLDIDPMNPSLILNSANEHFNRGELKRAEQLMLRAASAPEPARTISWHLGNFYDATGRFDESIRWAQEDIRGYKDNMEQFSREGIAYRIRLFAYTHLRLGSPDEAEALHQLRNSIYFDEYDDFMVRSYQTLLQGQMTEFTSLVGSIEVSMSSNH
jgi:adenylate cyclase